ncbi:beta-galactosidase [Paenibacillus pectinilyticus]|uniref:beta-galactosidase n=1 Tax=Paenibacillus pectinilyticus TaxID=512399 RepID=UPI000ACA170D|nr:beta-galactosidase [Paenibacillus pectinilyticus]
MQLSTSKEANVQLSPEALRIQGESKIILCASLFYFRLPRGLWKERLQQVKAFGYNAIDVYFPWNHHEIEEGVWDFTGEKDVAHFLQEASETGVWVIARPGPYICSEWDGGALPAYLFVKENMRLRDNDPSYLQHVARWYGQILPIIQSYEEGKGGSVIAVQLENELDYYPCSDPQGYIAALREMAMEHGIGVPLIACAGQGGLLEATGFAEGVVPTCNFYPNDRDPAFEEKVLCYRGELERRGYPLLVTETNRSHFLLRRLLSAGAKLLGPYLQASGTNFGFTNAANNWGDPVAFLTSDYDFHGMITPEGHIREEAYEGRLLHNVIQTYGSTLAEATPVSSATGPFRLALKQGGELVFLVNVHDHDECVYIENGREQVPTHTTLTAVAGHCPILPLQVPLQTWGIPVNGFLDYATAELLQVKQLSDRTLFVFHTDGVGEIRFSSDAALQMEVGTMQGHQETDDQAILIFQGTEIEKRAKVQLTDDNLIEIIGISRASALLFEGIDEVGNLSFGTPRTASQESQVVDITWKASQVNPALSLADNEMSLGEAASYLEMNGVYRGFAWYKAQLAHSPAANYQGFIVQQACDIVSLYAGETYLGTVTPGGASQWIPTTSSVSLDSELTARVEIWGHTNFHDTNLPALHLNSLKGLTGIVGVTSQRDLNQNWRFKLMQQADDKEEYANTSLDDQEWPIVSIGGWLSAEQPAHQCYRKRVKLSEEADSWILYTPGNFTYAYAFVNGHSLGQINPNNPYLDLTPHVKAGESALLTVFLDKTYVALSGQITLYEGISATRWTLSACQEQGLLQHAQTSKLSSRAIDGGITLKSGAVSWLYGELKDDNQGLGWRVYAKGKDMKLTVFFNGHLVGRLWTAGGANRPIFRGGSDDSFYLPGPWFHEQEEGNELMILLEAVANDDDAVLEPLQFVPVSAS